MHRTGSTTRTAVPVLAALAALCAPAQAQIHARAESGGFHYAVTDLDPADGVAADIRFNAAPAYMVSTDGSARQGQRQLVNTSDWRITTTPYAIAHDWIPQMHASAAYDPGGAAVETRLDPVVDGFDSARSTVTLQPWYFTLAPHTRLTFSVDVTVDLHLDPGPDATEYGSANGWVTLNFRQPDGFWSAPIHDTFGGTVGTAAWGDYGASYSGAGTALISWDNTGDTWVGGQLTGSVGSIVQVQWGVPAVPEPSSWAMLGLGAGLLGWRVRARSRSPS